MPLCDLVPLVDFYIDCNIELLTNDVGLINLYAYVIISKKASSHVYQLPIDR